MIFWHLVQALRRTLPSPDNTTSLTTDIEVWTARCVHGSKYGVRHIVQQFCLVVQMPRTWRVLFFKLRNGAHAVQLSRSVMRRP